MRTSRGCELGGWCRFFFERLGLVLLELAWAAAEAELKDAENTVRLLVLFFLAWAGVCAEVWGPAQLAKALEAAAAAMIDGQNSEAGFEIPGYFELPLFLDRGQRERQERYIDRRDVRGAVAVGYFVGAAALQCTLGCFQPRVAEAHGKGPASSFSSKGKGLRLFVDWQAGVEQGDKEVYASSSGRMLDMSANLLCCGVTSHCTAFLHRRLCGGSREDVPGQWACGYCHALRCWPAHKRCYRCGEVRMDAPVAVPPRVVDPLGQIQPTPQRSTPMVSVKQQQPRPWANAAEQTGHTPGAGVGPISVPKAEDTTAAEIFRALQPLQSVMSADDFSKYEKVLAFPKKRRERTSFVKKHFGKKGARMSKLEHNLEQRAMLLEVRTGGE